MRAVSAADLDLLVRHRRGMWKEIHHYGARALNSADVVYRRFAAKELKSGRLVGFVIEDGDGRALASGCVWTRAVHPRPGRLGGLEPYILSMFTEPDARGRGLARTILRKLLQWCRARGFKKVTLHASDAGRPLYEQFGFSATREMQRTL